MTWSGPLHNKQKYLADVLLTTFSDTDFPCPIGNFINITAKASFAKLRVILPVPIFTDGTPSKNRQPPARHGQVCFYYCEISSKDDQQNHCRKLFQYFLNKEWAGIVDFTNDHKLYIIPTSSFSEDLGLSVEGDTPRLHGLVVWKESVQHAAAKSVPEAVPTPDALPPVQVQREPAPAPSNAVESVSAVPQAVEAETVTTSRKYSSAVRIKRRSNASLTTVAADEGIQASWPTASTDGETQIESIFGKLPSGEPREVYNLGVSRRTVATSPATTTEGAALTTVITTTAATLPQSKSPSSNVHADVSSSSATDSPLQPAPAQQQQQSPRLCVDNSNSATSPRRADEVHSATTEAPSVTTPTLGRLSKHVRESTSHPSRAATNSDTNSPAAAVVSDSNAIRNTSAASSCPGVGIGRLSSRTRVSSSEPSESQITTASVVSPAPPPSKVGLGRLSSRLSSIAASSTPAVLPPASLPTTTTEQSRPSGLGRLSHRVQRQSVGEVSSSSNLNQTHASSKSSGLAGGLQPVSGGSRGLGRLSSRVFSKADASVTNSDRSHVPARNKHSESQPRPYETDYSSRHNGQVEIRPNESYRRTREQSEVAVASAPFERRDSLEEDIELAMSSVAEEDDDDDDEFDANGLDSNGDPMDFEEVDSEDSVLPASSSPQRTMLDELEGNSMSVLMNVAVANPFLHLLLARLKVQQTNEMVEKVGQVLTSFPAGSDMDTVHDAIQQMVTSSLMAQAVSGGVAPFQGSAAAKLEPTPPSRRRRKEPETQGQRQEQPAQSQLEQPLPSGPSSAVPCPQHASSPVLVAPLSASSPDQELISGRKHESSTSPGLIQAENDWHGSNGNAVASTPASTIVNTTQLEQAPGTDSRPGSGSALTPDCSAVSIDASMLKQTDVPSSSPLPKSGRSLALPPPPPPPPVVPQVSAATAAVPGGSSERTFASSQAVSTAGCLTSPTSARDTSVSTAATECLGGKRSGQDTHEDFPDEQQTVGQRKRLLRRHPPRSGVTPSVPEVEGSDNEHLPQQPIMDMPAPTQQSSGNPSKLRRLSSRVVPAMETQGANQAAHDPCPLSLAEQMTPVGLHTVSSPQSTPVQSLSSSLATSNHVESTLVGSSSIIRSSPSAADRCTDGFSGGASLQSTSKLGISRGVGRLSSRALVSTSKPLSGQTSAAEGSVSNQSSATGASAGAGQPASSTTGRFRLSSRLGVSSAKSLKPTTDTEVSEGACGDGDSVNSTTESPGTLPPLNSLPAHVSSPLFPSYAAGGSAVPANSNTAVPDEQNSESMGSRCVLSFALRDTRIPSNTATTVTNNAFQQSPETVDNLTEQDKIQVSASSSAHSAVGCEASAEVPSHTQLNSSDRVTDRTATATVASSVDKASAPAVAAASHPGSNSKPSTLLGRKLGTSLSQGLGRLSSRTFTLSRSLS